MTAADLIDLIQLALWTLTITSAPAIAAAMLTGTAIATLQALTQVQEVTLTFVPKIAAVLLALVMSATLIGSSIQYLAEECYGRISATQR